MSCDAGIHGEVLLDNFLSKTSGVGEVLLDNFLSKTTGVGKVLLDNFLSKTTPSTLSCASLDAPSKVRASESALVGVSFNAGK